MLQSKQYQINKNGADLMKSQDFFKKIVVSKSSMKPWTDEDGIVHLGLYDFLSNEDLINM